MITFNREIDINTLLIPKWEISHSSSLPKPTILRVILKLLMHLCWLHMHRDKSCYLNIPLQALHPLISHLHRFHHMKVGHILVSKLGMLGQVDIFLGHHDSLLEEELVDSNAVLFGHQHLCRNKKSTYQFQQAPAHYSLRDSMLAS